MYLRSPFVLGPPVYGNNFFGRRESLAKISSLLQVGSAINFYSLRRMGKTSLLRQIEYLCENDVNWRYYQPVHLDLQATYDSSLVYNLLRRLGVKGVRGQVEVEDAWLEVERISQETQETERQILLLIDEADGWVYDKLEAHERDFMHLRMLQQLGALNIVVCTAYASLADHLQYHGEVASPFYNIFQTLRVPSFLPQEAIELLTTLCARGNVQLNSHIAGELAHYVGYYPQMVQELGDHAFRCLSEGSSVLLEHIAYQWRGRGIEFWLPTILRLFEKDYVGISVRPGGVSREDYLTESLEAYGILMRNELGVLTVAPYMQDLLRGKYSAEEMLGRLQALADSANRNQRKNRGISEGHNVENLSAELSSDSSRMQLKDTSMISILFLAADPTDASRLRLGEEFREIHEKLQLATLREHFRLELPRLSIRPADITQALLDTRPHIVHFSGHGMVTGELCFENQIGETHPIQPDALAALFEQFEDQVNCVVLSACYSETQAKAIAEHVDCVIGMSEAIGDKAAIAFAIGFYQALGAGRSVEDAYKLGCVQIRLQGIPEHLIPVLIKKEQAQL